MQKCSPLELQAGVLHVHVGWEDCCLEAREQDSLVPCSSDLESERNVKKIPNKIAGVAARQLKGQVPSCWNAAPCRVRWGLPRVRVSCLDDGGWGPRSGCSPLEASEFQPQARPASGAMHGGLRLVSAKCLLGTHTRTPASRALPASLRPGL